MIGALTAGSRRACCAAVRPPQSSRALPRSVAKAYAPVRRLPLNHRLVRLRSTDEARSASASPAEKVRKELADLEKERDEAVQTAESCAKTSMKVNEMVDLLEEMALEKLKKGDEEGAKRSLQEKAAAKDVVVKSKTKAELNYALAARLATKIGEKQNELLTILRGNLPPSSSAAASSSTTSASTAATSSSFLPSGSSTASDSQSSSYYPPVPNYSSPSSPASTYSSGSAGSDYSSYTSGSYGEATTGNSFTDKLKKIEREAENRARAARLEAEDSINAARERLREKGFREDILTARERLKKKDVESIAEAQARLRAQDAEVLQYVRSIMARYKRGEYVSEDELEFAG